MGSSDSALIVLNLIGPFVVSFLVFVALILLGVPLSLAPSIALAAMGGASLLLLIMHAVVWISNAIKK